MEFRRFTLSDADLVKGAMESVKTFSYFYKISNPVLWSDMGISIAVGKKGIYEWIEETHTFLMPLSHDLKSAMEELSEWARINGIHPKIVEVPERYAERLKEYGYSIERSRDDDEYLYMREALETLSGKKLQAKRNHIHQFEREYPDWSYSPMTKEDRSECFHMLDEWLEEARPEKMESVEDERKAIYKAFECWDYLGLTGAMIRVKDHLVAFTIGETTSDETIIHFEKADRAFLGSYALINRDYLLKTASPSKYVNRQEDLGLEGLRRAKESYQPTAMVKKYIIRLE